MSLPLSAVQKRVLDTALVDRDTLASNSSWSFMVGGEDYTRFLEDDPERASFLTAMDPTRAIKEHSFSAGDGPAMLLDATIPARLPETLEYKDATLDQVIDGVPFRVFTGEVVTVDTSERGYTTLSCASRSTRTENVALPSTLLEYSNSDPGNALYEVLSTLGYGSHVDIPQIPEQTFTRLGDDAFSWTDRVSDVAEAIREDTGLTFFDDGHGVARGYLEESLTKAGASVMELEAGIDLVDYEHATRYTERYSEIRVFYVRSDGVDELLARVETGIPGLGPLDIEVSDTSILKAQDRAFREALTIQTDHREATFTLLFPLPHLSRTDTLAITEVERGAKRGRPGRWRRRYLMRLTGFSADETKRMSVSGIQRMVSEVFEEEPESIAVGPVSGIVHPPFGTDYLGEPYFSDSLAWVSQDADGIHLILNVERAEADGVLIFVDPTDVGVVVASERPLSAFTADVRVSDERTIGVLGDHTIGVLSA